MHLLYNRLSIIFKLRKQIYKETLINSWCGLTGGKIFSSDATKTTGNNLFITTINFAVRFFMKYDRKYSDRQSVDKLISVSLKVKCKVVFILHQSFLQIPCCNLLIRCPAYI